LIGDRIAGPVPRQADKHGSNRGDDQDADGDQAPAPAAIRPRWAVGVSGPVRGMKAVVGHVTDLQDRNVTVRPRR
jgi:hypothetical protein